MDFLVIASTFALIFLAELPDKSMFAAVVLGTRYNPLYVWLGLAAAFLIHVTIAVTAGHLVTFLPDQLVAGAVTLIFFAGAFYLLLAGGDSKAKGKGEKEAGELNVSGKSSLRVVTGSFGVIFVSEWGDLTQLATINLTARYGDPLSVAIGSVSALWLVTGLGVLLGSRLVKVIPLRLVRRGAALVLFGLAIWSLVDFVQTF